MENKNTINKLICEFDEKNIEKGFLEWENEKKGQLFMKVVLVLGVILLLFMIIDISILGLSLNTFFILFFRVLMVTTCMILTLAIKNKEKYSRILFLTTTCEFTTILSFLAIYSLYTKADILQHSLSMIALMVVIVIIPNRFSRIVFLYFFGYIMFVIITITNYSNNDISMNNLLPSITLLGVIVVTLIIFSHMMNFYNRVIYVNHLELMELASTDNLTKIYNRTRFQEEINKWFSISKRYKNPLCLLEFDIDNFKAINDKHGHFTGDEVLMQVALKVKEVVRETDVFARWGGDEFMILLPNISLQEAYDVSSRTRKIINTIKVDGSEKVDCSIGLVVKKEDDKVRDLMLRADRMLYISKRAGKGIITCEQFKGIKETPMPITLKEELNGE